MNSLESIGLFFFFTYTSEQGTHEKKKVWFWLSFILKQNTEEKNSRLES